MDIKNRQLSVFELLGLSFRAANQAFGSALAVFIMVGLFDVLCIAIIIVAILLFGPLATLLQIPAILLCSFLTLVAMVAVIQIIASKIEKTGITFWDAFTSSFLPAFYCLVSSFIVSIPTSLIFFGATLSNSIWVVNAVLLVVFFLFIPLFFLTPVLALRDEGPISALVYSWRLGMSHYIRVLWTLVVLTFLMAVFSLATVCALKAFFPDILIQQGPIPTPVLISLVKAHWYYFLIGSLIWSYLSLVIQAVVTSLFLNLDYQHRSTQNREADLKMDNQAPVMPTVAITPEIQVKQAIVETATDEHTDIHLEQVYTASDHTPQIIEQEEDRMPTILFDEDMARQLAENERKMQEQQNKSDTDKDSEDTGPIKISKKPL